MPSPRTARVSAGSMMPSSQSRDDAIVPESRGRVIRRTLRFVLVTDSRLELLALALRAESADHGQDDGGLLAAHDTYAGVRPHPKLARLVGAAVHAVVPRAEAAADDYRELRHDAACDRGHHLRAVLGDPTSLVLPADHEAGDILQEDERNAALITELDEVRRLQRRLAE